MKNKKIKLIIFLVVIMLCIIPTLVVQAADIKYTKSDTILRKSSSQTSKAINVLPINTKVAVLKTITKSDGTVYNQIKVMDTNTEGYVLKRQLSSNWSNINNSNFFISIKNKLKIINLAEEIAYNTNTTYSQKEWNRYKGYNGVKDNGTYYFDCSSFCSFINNKIFNIDLTDKTEEKQNGYYQPWRVLDYLNNSFTYKKKTFSYDNYVTKSGSLFEVVDYATTNGDSIDLSKLQVGDLIMGIRVFNNNGKRSTKNHIMLYVGEGYIMHAWGGTTKGYSVTGIKANTNFSGVVHERLINSSNTRQKFFTKIGDNFREQDYTTCRFNSIVAILRYKELAKVQSGKPVQEFIK